jgi:hypothetical protein
MARHVTGVVCAIVLVCATGFHNVPSLLDAALFHICHINTPLFWVKIWHCNQALVQQECSKRARLRAGDAYSSYLTDHSHLELAEKTVAKRPRQTTKPECCAVFALVHTYPKTHSFSLSSTTDAHEGYTCIQAHAGTVQLVHSMHTKPHVTFRCMLSASLNQMDTGFRHQFPTVVRAWASSK